MEEKSVATGYFTETSQSVEMWGFRFAVLQGFPALKRAQKGPLACCSSELIVLKRLFRMSAKLCTEEEGAHKLQALAVSLPQFSAVSDLPSI